MFHNNQKSWILNKLAALLSNLFIDKSQKLRLSKSITHYNIEWRKSPFLRSNIIHLMHRQILTIKTYIFAFGKAFSPTWQMGVKGYNWWETELPNNQEVYY